MCCHRSVTRYSLAGGNFWELQVLGMRWQGRLVATGLGRGGYRSLCPGASLSDIFDHSLPFLWWYRMWLTLPCHYPLMKNISFSAANPDLCPRLPLVLSPKQGWHFCADPESRPSLLDWVCVPSTTDQCMYHVDLVMKKFYTRQFF